MKSTPPLPENNLLQAFEAAGVVEYLEYLKSGKRIFWLNFKAGVAKGLGLTVGLAVVLALTFWLLTKLVDLPLVGEYFAEAQFFLTEYADKTDYSDEFSEMNELLREINENLKE
jgi:hypothetical protein